MRKYLTVAVGLLAITFATSACSSMMNKDGMASGSSSSTSASMSSSMSSSM